jgi:hypothetical protein
LFGKSSGKPDKYAFRGDADSFDTDAKGPGHVPDSPDNQQWDSFNWAGEETNKWMQIGTKNRRD